ncbi:MAG: hypothetical protein WC797_04220 [Candidatus Paceibacterota bacterium]|jgi:hypothetical protein
MNRTRSLLFVCLCFILILTGCEKPFTQLVLDKFGPQNWTPIQEDCALQQAHLVEFCKKIDDNKWVINRGVITFKDIRTRLDSILKDYEYVLNYSNEELNDYLGVFGLRAYLDNQEKIFEVLRDRYRTLELEVEFNQMIGSNSSSFSCRVGVPIFAPFPMPSYGPVFDPFSPMANPDEMFDIKKVFPNGDFQSLHRFNSPQVDSARHENVLRQVEKASVQLYRKYDRKNPNPENPRTKNDFIWRSSARGLIATGYKIQDDDTEKPNDNRLDYVEVTRESSSGKTETSPCVKVYFPEGRSIAVIYTAEEGKPGYGLPSEIASVRYASVKDIITDENLARKLFNEQVVNPNRVPPAKPGMKIEIAKIDAPIDLWEDAPTKAGWPTPVGYKNATANNYNVRIKLEKSKDSSSATTSVSSTATSTTTSAPAKPTAFGIEYVIKEWTITGKRYEAASGNPVEYYKAKGVFARYDIAKAEVLHVVDTKSVQIVRNDGAVFNGFLIPGNPVIENEPYQILYKRGRNKWWLIRKSPGSTVFDKRRPASPPSDTTGVYKPSASPGDFDSDSFSDDNDLDIDSEKTVKNR